MTNLRSLRAYADIARRSENSFLMRRYYYNIYSSKNDITY